MEGRSETQMHLDAHIKEPAVCPGCGHNAQACDLCHVLIAFAEGRCITSRFRCGLCGQVFETESLGPTQPTGRPVEVENAQELEHQVEELLTFAQEQALV
jgi:hypothetical protein